MSAASSSNATYYTRSSALSEALQALIAATVATATEINHAVQLNASAATKKKAAATAAKQGATATKQGPFKGLFASGYSVFAGDKVICMIKDKSGIADIGS